MKKITVIGGDKRLAVAREQLIKNGYRVDTLGLFDNDDGDIKSSDCLLLPVPTTKDKVNIFTPLTERKIPISYIAENADDRQLILCCNYSFHGKNCIDYNRLDRFCLLNAVPTAEGALKLAIENTDRTLWNSRVLVIGNGRVGKVLAIRLKALGADVTVSARKADDFAYLNTMGFSFINTNSIKSLPLDYSIIFNTVDAKIISSEVLKDCTAELIIDLSTIGGVDFPTAQKYGIKAFKAPGLPGIIAPQTAGEILANTVSELIDEYI